MPELEYFDIRHLFLGEVPIGQVVQQGCDNSAVNELKCRDTFSLISSIRNKGGRGERERVGEREEQDCSVWPEKDKFNWTEAGFICSKAQRLEN